MDYVLYAYGSVLFVAVFGAVWTAGGTRARLVLSLGAYAFHPRYEPPSRVWRREQAHHRRGRQHDFQGWQEYLTEAAEPQPSPTPGIDAGSTVTLPTLVHAEMAADGSDSGAEHWGALLDAMNTEEREIYSAERLEIYEATKQPERTFLTELDAAIDRFTTAMTELDRRHPAMYEGMGANLVRRHGGGERWATGQYPRYEPAAV